MMEMQPSGGWRPVRRRQRNPTLGGLSFGWSDALQSALGRLLGKAAAAWAVRSLGNAEENQISGGASPTTGLRWSCEEKGHATPGPKPGRKSKPARNMPLFGGGL